MEFIGIVLRIGEVAAEWSCAAGLFAIAAAVVGVAIWNKKSS